MLKITEIDDNDLMTAEEVAANDAKNLKSLGSGNTKYPTEYDPSVLERFPNPNPGSDDLVGLDCFEFRSLCPLTHQPDLATIHICYIPNKWMVESKSIKLYLFSYANHGAFHERCVHTIMEDLVKLLNPKYLEVYGDFNSRGGVCILPFAQHSTDEYEEFKKARKLQMMDVFTTHKPRH